MRSGGSSSILTRAFASPPSACSARTAAPAGSAIATALRDADPAVRVTAARCGPRRARLVRERVGRRVARRYQLPRSTCARGSGYATRHAARCVATVARRRSLAAPSRCGDARRSRAGERRRWSASTPAFATPTAACAPRRRKRSPGSWTAPASRSWPAGACAACCWIPTSSPAPPHWARWPKARASRISRPRCGLMPSRVETRISMRASRSGHSPTRRSARTARRFPTASRARSRRSHVPTEPLERSRAASIARFAAWRDSTSEPREDAWYRARAREALAPSSPVARIETERGTHRAGPVRRRGARHRA